MYKLFVASALVCGATVANASMLLDQGPATGPYGGAWQCITGAQLIADSFTLGQSSTITEYDMFSIESGAAPSYNLVLYSDSGNAPGATLLTLSNINPSSYGVWGTQGGNTIYEGSFTGLSINVNAGTKYWIDVSGNGADAG